MKYWILTYEPNGLKDFFSINEIEADNDYKAREILEEGQSNYSVDLLMNKAELDDLIKTIEVFNFKKE